MDPTAYLTTEKQGIDAFYSLDYNLDDPKARRPAKARTQDSDFFAKGVFFNAITHAKNNNLPLPNRKDPQYSTARPRLASHIDLGPWFMDQQNRASWPKLSKDKISLVMTEEFIEKFVTEGTGKRTPIDALVNLDVAILHEVSATQ
jgi:hypothetical protein